jgi:hypothetical protein
MKYIPVLFMEFIYTEKVEISSYVKTRIRLRIHNAATNCLRINAYFFQVKGSGQPAELYIDLGYIHLVAGNLNLSTYYSVYLCIFFAELVERTHFEDFILNITGTQHIANLNTRIQ